MSRIEIPPDVKARLLDETRLPEQLKLDGHTYTPQACAGSGYKAVVWKVTNQNARPRAAKLAVYADYVDRPWIEELQRAAALEDYPVFARLETAGVTSLNLNELGEFRCVYFVEEWVDGISLEAFLDTTPEAVTPTFLLHYATTMAEALFALKATGLQHDDLHAGNVMLSPAPPGSFDESRRIRIVDMGSLKPTRDVVKPKSDLDHVLDHLVAIYNTIVRQRRMNRRERRFMRECQLIFEQMVDPEPTRVLQDPKLINDAFMTAESSSIVGQDGTRPISTPFEFISSEHIADDKTFIELFAETPWVERVASRDPCLLTGPRGCGKSTLFRWLSLKTQLASPEPDLTRFPIAGFYISCSTELEGRFSWVNSEELAKQYERDIIHYFNLVLAHELVDTLLAMLAHQEATRGDESLEWRITPHDEQAVLALLTDGLGVNAFGIQGVGALEQALDLIDRERWRCGLALRQGIHCERPTDEAFLGDVTERVTEIVPFFNSQRIAFLIDDFTARRLNRHVQVSLNRVIRLRRDSLLFKVSSEKRGMEMTDAGGMPLEISRELVEIDVGREFLNLADTPQVKRGRLFATRLLDNRLHAARWAGTAEMLIGPSDWGEHRTLDRALRDGKDRSQYHGMECIADLCSGDVSTLLLVYRRIFDAARVTAETTDRISKARQHGSIRQVSADQVELVRTHVPAGQAMHHVVQEFGTFVGNVLRRGREIDQGQGRSVPPTCPRIEVDGGAEAAEQLDPELAQLYDELIRRAIFIEMETGLGRHRNVQTLRWQLRRVYLPTYRAALNKTRAVVMTPAEFKFFLHRPEEACKSMLARWPKRVDEGPSEDDPQIQIEIDE